MKFDPCYCPKCGGIAVSVTEGVLVRSGIVPTVEGDLPEFDYDGNGCKVDWDTQELKLFDGENEQDSVNLQCENGHGWLAEYEPQPARRKPKRRRKGGDPSPG